MSNHRYHYIECGLPNVWLENGFEIRETPYGEGVSIHDVDGLNRAIGLALSEGTAPLTEAEFRFLRLEMDMSQKALGRLLGKDEQSISLYERSGNIPDLVDRAVRQFYLEYCHVDGKFRDLMDRFVALDNQIQDLERELSFMETPSGWEPKAA
ncbi:MAG: transcriptional regulator [Pseudohongiella sp.]|nr:transcriptional regulator [Pseudohongiella sp.]